MTVVHSETERCCRVCNGPLLVTRGEWVCMQCGAVDSSLLLVPTFATINCTAYGNRPHLVDGLGSYLNFADQLSFNSLKLHRWKRLNLRLKTNHCATDYRSLSILNRVCAFLQVSDPVRDRAAYLYKVVAAAEHYNKIEKVSNHVVLAALCLLVAIRESAVNAPVRFSELIKVFNDLGHRLSGRSIGKLAMSLPAELGLSLKPSRSEDYLPRIISLILEQEEIQVRLQLIDLEPRGYGQQLLHLSKELLQKITFRSRGGVNPYIFAVSVVYAAGRLLAKQTGGRILRQKHLAEICQVAEYSIRTHFRVLKERLKEDLESDE